MNFFKLIYFFFYWMRPPFYLFSQLFIKGGERKAHIFLGEMFNKIQVSKYQGRLGKDIQGRLQMD
ncbi:MAG: hypothetical protein BME94_05490 [Methanobacteriales archaeon Met13]